MTVVLRFVGSGDAFGTGGRLQTCLHLSGAELSVLIDCGTIEPAQVATMLTGMFGDQKSGGPYVAAVPEQNSVAVNGSAEQIAAAQQAVRALNSQPGIGTGNVGEIPTGTGTMRSRTNIKKSAISIACWSLSGRKSARLF